MQADPAASAPPDVVCRGLAKTYDGARGAVQAVRPFDLAFAAGRTTRLAVTTFWDVRGGGLELHADD